MQITVNRRLAAAALTAGLFGGLAALPASSASASASPSSGQTSLNVGSGVDGASPVTPATTTGPVLDPLSTTEIEKLLAGLPISSLPIGTATGEIAPEALAKALASLPVLSDLGLGDLEAPLKSTLEKLTPGETLSVLENPTTLVPTLASTLDSVLKLDGLLNGKSLSTELESTLSKVSLSELLPGLLESAASPQALLEELLSGLPAELAEEILHSKLSESPVATMTVSELATDLGTTGKALAAALGETAAQLPETANALLKPLANGELLTVLDGTNRLLLGTVSGLLGVKGAEQAEGTKGTGETKGASGPSGASGTNGTNGTSGAGGGSTNLTVNAPATSTTPGTTTTGTSATSKKAAKKTTGKIAVLKYTIHGHVATVSVHAPGAGKLTARHKDVAAVNRNVAAAKDLSFHVVLSRAGAAAVRRSKDRSLALKLRIVFAPTNGPRSHAILKLRFR